MGPAREAEDNAVVVGGAKDGRDGGVEGEVLGFVAVEHVRGARGGGGTGGRGFGEGWGDVRVDPEGPEGVVEVEDDEGGEREGVGECFGDGGGGGGWGMASGHFVWVCVCVCVYAA